MIVDDDDDVRVVLALRFASAGYAVATAANGAEMIHLLASSDPPTAIFVDLLMPGVLGTSVLEYVQHDVRLADVPTAIVTASPELAPGGFRVFTKPTPFRVLLDFVRDHETSN